MSSFMRTFNRKMLVAKKNSPHIFFVLGVGGVISSTILACRATLRLSDTLDDIQHEIDGVKELRHSETELVEIKDDSYSVQEWRKDTAYVYTKSGLRIIKLYGPSVVIGVISIGALTGSHVQLSRRNAALTAAYAAIAKAFSEYRERVRDQYGAQNELDIYRGVESYELVEKSDGTKELVAHVDTNKLSPYAKFFDEFSPNWERSSELNRLFLQAQQNYANDLLQSRGHVFLNEVYDMIGVDRSQAGAVVGWVIGETGDNFVDFGIFEAFNSRFVNGMEQSILLDFNVDGVIYDKI